MKKILFLSGIVLTFAFAGSASAATPNWDITGSWALTFTCTSGCGGSYPHTMSINVFSNTTGNFSGTGFYNVNPTIAWTVTGTVEGDDVDFIVDYDASNYAVVVTGAIAGNGLSMSGTAAGPGQTFTWTAIGEAVSFDRDGDGYYSNVNDCDDADDAVYPGATEVCNGVDDDCDGVVDDGLDTDGDGVNGCMLDKCLGTGVDNNFSGWNQSKGRYIWDGEDWLVAGKGAKGFTPDMDYTYGCSCDQILDELVIATGLPFDGHYKYGCSKSILEDWAAGEYFIETVEVPANSVSPVSSFATLNLGEDYFLKAYGTACAEENITDICTIYFDAEYSTIDGWTTWADGVTGYESYGLNLLDLTAAGGFVNWGVYDVGHKYQIPYTGTGSTVSFVVNDVYSVNNTGSLFVDIFADLW